MKINRHVISVGPGKRDWLDSQKISVIKPTAGSQRRMTLFVKVRIAIV